MGAGHPESIARVAERGHHLRLDQFAPIEQTGERIAIFKREVKARGRIFDPMTVAVTRSVHVVMTAAEKEKAVEVRMAARRRTERLAQRPDGQNKASIMSYAMTPEAAEESALYGTRDEITAKIQTLERLGARYVLLNSAGGPETLRRFAREVMPVSRASRCSIRWGEPLRADPPGSPIQVGRPRQLTNEFSGAGRY